ncbi:MAG: FkbM family methyltransferase [Planctomycetaceae bacterium]
MPLGRLVRRVVDAARLCRKAFLTNHVRVHYAQFGEDVALREIFGRRRSGLYVDVGCYHPRKYSNTHALHRRGWHGINVDMEAAKIRMFRMVRPRDWNVVAAVSDVPGTVRMYRTRDFGLETTIDEAVARRVRDRLPANAACETVEVPARTLEDIIASSPFNAERIDLLSIDAEGHDFAVLRSLDLDARRPEVIVIEEHDGDIESILRGEMYAHLRSRGYRLHAWHAPSLIFRLPAGA